MPEKGNAKNIFTAKGCKNTRSRKAIAEVLGKAEQPVTAEEIFFGIREMGATTNLSTVYRTLELMEEKGLTVKTMMGDGKARYELTGDGHRHHLICIGCHKMVPIEGCPLEELAADLGKKNNFNITGHKLELYGFCPKCSRD